MVEAGQVKQVCTGKEQQCVQFLTLEGVGRLCDALPVDQRGCRDTHAARYTTVRMGKKNQTPPKTFEDALQELEQILAEIETGQTGLEDSLAQYERGTFL